MTILPISTYPVPKLEDLPEDIRAKMLDVQKKAGFIPNVFVTLAKPEGRTHLPYYVLRNRLRYDSVVQMQGHSGVV